MMKNVAPYRLLEAFPLAEGALADLLAKRLFHPCQPLEMNSRGWVEAVPGGHSLVHAVAGCFLIRLQVESKILPPSVVRDFVNERVAEIEQNEMRTVRRRERQQITEEVTFDLMPRAFTRTASTQILIDTVNHWLVVDASSWSKAEEATEFLRETLGSLPIAPPATIESPQATMTQWLLGEQPADIEVGDTAVLEDPTTEGGLVTLKRQDLFSPESLAHLKVGKRVRRLAVTWANRIECVLDADYAIRGFRFTDTAMAPVDATEYDTAAERMSAEMALMVGELRAFLPALMRLWGGEAAVKPRSNGAVEVSQPQGRGGVTLVSVNFGEAKMFAPDERAGRDWRSGQVEGEGG